jgi:hypothetical protein
MITWIVRVRGVKGEVRKDTRGPGTEKASEMYALLGRQDAKACRDRALFRLLWDLALRRSEIVGLDLEHVDLEKSFFKVRGNGCSGYRASRDLVGRRRSMQSLLLLKADDGSFEPSEVEHVFRSDSRFKDLRISAPHEGLTECTCVERNDRAIIYLSDDRGWLSLSNTGRAALQAVLIIQKALGIPLRVIDSNYTFDLTFSDISTVEELEAAMDNAPTS